MHMRGETVGTFIDAVYAIAVTILALEIPGTLSGGRFGVLEFSDVLVEYAVAFVLLFAFWLQHRRVNGLVDDVSRVGLWLNGAILMLVCLVPRATTLVFQFGDDVTVSEIGETLTGRVRWTTAEVVDLFYVLVVIAIDLGILVLLQINRRTAGAADVRHIHRSKTAVSLMLVLVIGASFLLPVENRYFLLVIPLVLFFENEVSQLLGRFGRSS